MADPEPKTDPAPAKVVHETNLETFSTKATAGVAPADRPPPGIRAPSAKVEPAAKPAPSTLQQAIAQARKECGCLGCVGKQKPTMGGYQRAMNGGHPLGCVAAPVLAHLLAKGGQL